MVPWPGNTTTHNKGENVKRNKWLLSIVAALILAFVGSGCGATEKTPGGSGGSVSASPPVGVGGPVVKGRPAWANPNSWHEPVNPVGAPPLPPKQDGPQTHMSESKACYPSSVGVSGGYQSDCVGIGFEGGTSYPGMHWGNEPFYGTGRRYVWVVDELAVGSRERDWLQYVVNQYNAIAVDSAGNSINNRPYFLYYKGEDIGWGNCTSTQAQTEEFCYQSGVVSRAAWNYNGSMHMTWVDAYIGNSANSRGDYFVEYSVAHEFGHLIGSAHNSDCQSVMTYCSTVGTQYLWYHGDDTTVYVANYDSHQ